MSCCAVDGEGSIRASAAPRVMPWWRIVVGLLATGQIMVVGLAMNLGEPPPAVRLSVHGALLVATLVVLGLVGAPLRAALARSLRERAPTFDWLFTTAIFGSLVHSLNGMARGGDVYFEVASLLIVIHALGERANRARRDDALRGARAIVPNPEWVDRVSCCGKVTRIALGQLRVGDLVRVHPGKTLPVDGTVTEGEAWLQEAWWTGEPLPRTRDVGDRVRAGSHLVDGSLTLRATAVVGERAVDEVERRVLEARAHPSPLQRLADRLARWMLPLVLMVATATFAFWAAIGTLELGWQHAMAVLLVACPCAMGFATPVAFWVALRRLTSVGIEPRDLESVERLAQIDVAVFDKTGVLTDPAPVVRSLEVEGPIAAETLLAWMHALEASSPHPIARSLATATERWREPSVAVSAVRVVAAKGIEGHLTHADRSHVVRIGRFEAGLPDDVLVIEVDGRSAGRMTLGETIRPEVDQLRRELDTLGIETVVLTGDRTARAKALGLPVIAELSPEEKHDEVAVLRRAGSRVLFVGDGLNDAAAMAEAHVAIAPDAGASLPRDIAGLAWHGQRVGAVVEAIRIARQTVHTVRSNLLFAGFYNAVAMAAAAAGLLHPVWAALLMTASSFLVTLRAGAFETGEAASVAARAARADAPLRALAEPAVRRRPQALAAQTTPRSP